MAGFGHIIEVILLGEKDEETGSISSPDQYRGSGGDEISVEGGWCILGGGDGYDASLAGRGDQF